ncbi:hypothetical protein BGW42_007375 [Actinomortierella wolfii]|nr:hypothetical protein BGW42_007375 [Actinomortierella wolfii]
MVVPLRSSWQASVVTAGALIFAAAWLPSVTAQLDPMTVCKGHCDSVVDILAPCGGGATNETLQQDLIFTPTKSLGGCECNQVFYGALSSCLHCIASQGRNEPEIQDYNDFVASCKSYGFSFTQTPIRNSTHPGIVGPEGDSGSSGLSGGAIAGIVIGALAVIALAVAGFVLSKRRKRTKFEQVEASSVTDGYASTPTQAEFSPLHNNYHNSNYQQDDYYQDDQGQNQYYQSSADMYNQHQQHGNQEYQGYDQSGYDPAGYDHNTYAMQSIPVTSAANTDYVPPPVSSPTTAAAVALGAASLGPRPPDSQPQSLRNKTNAWASASRDDMNNNSNPTLHNDKALYDEDEELEPPRSRERFRTDHEEFRRSLTPPRAAMQSYKDDLTRPSFERGHHSRPSLSGSERGSVTGLGMVRGANGSSDALESSPLGRGDSPEANRRRERAAELFSAEGKR